ncbi:hypothetical protein [Spirillospora sp. NPDC029432]|uniref:hypothetical protein n=1 Tax=Spirillospora sp. NPDC029432 TaxID=3154599 RepID=UPI003456477E
MTQRDVSSEPEVPAEPVERKPGAVGLWPVGAGWLVLAASVTASLALAGARGAALFAPGVVGLLAGVLIGFGCARVLRPARAGWGRGAVGAGVMLGFWTFVGAIAYISQSGMEVQTCVVAEVAQEKTGYSAKTAYRYRVTCPSGVHSILETPAKNRSAPAAVYSPGRRLTVSYDPGGHRSARFGESRGMVFLLLAGPAALAILTAVTLAVRRGGGARPLPGPWPGRALIGAGWLTLPAGVALNVYAPLPQAGTVAAIVVPLLCLLGGAALAAAGDTRTLARFLPPVLILALPLTFGMYETAEKLRMAAEGREYTCTIALERTVPGSQVKVRGDFVLCPNGSHARMEDSFGPGDEGDRVRVAWDPERRYRATLSSDLEPFDLARRLALLPLAMLVPLFLVWFLPVLGELIGASSRRPPEDAPGRP